MLISVVRCMYVNMCKFFVCIYMFTLCIGWWLYQREHLMFALLGLAYFTECNGFQLGPFCCRWQDFIPLCGLVVVH